MVKVVGAFVDTLVLNVYPTDASFQPEARRVAPELQEELRQMKDAAQEAEEDIPTRFVFAGVPLLMTSKAESGLMDNVKNRSTQNTSPMSKRDFTKNARARHRATL